MPTYSTASRPHQSTSSEDNGVLDVDPWGAFDEALQIAKPPAGYKTLAELMAHYGEDVATETLRRNLNNKVEDGTLDRVWYRGHWHYGPPRP